MGSKPAKALPDHAPTAFALACECDKLTSISLSFLYGVRASSIAGPPKFVLAKVPQCLPQHVTSKPYLPATQRPPDLFQRVALKILMRR